MELSTSPKPSVHLLSYWGEALRRHEPFASLTQEQVRTLVLSAREQYAAAQTLLLQPEDGIPSRLCWIRQGSLIGQPLASEQEVFELEAGSLWPVGALIGQRPVRTRYLAREDCFYLSFPWDRVQAVMAQSPVLNRYLHQQAASLQEASSRQLRLALMSRQQHDAGLERPLSVLPAKPVLCMPDQTRLRQALLAMQSQQVGSVLFTGPDGRLSGILTRHDLLEQVVLPGHSLEAPAAEVMRQPVHAIDVTDTLAEAATRMVRLGIRHLPVMRAGQVVNILSERDLFHLQQKTLRHVGTRVQAASTTEELTHAAAAIRELAAHLLAQGTAPQVLTPLISDLNDKLTRRIIRQALAHFGLSAHKMCWLALGSEGRQEQTIATDQDNALIFESETPERDRSRWQALARQVNETLDACGYPLCKGGVMASTAAWCRTLQEWKALSAQWMEQGSPADLLQSAVLFDLRALHGRAEWAQALQQHMLERVRATPRFLKQWVENHLQTGVALNWHGGLAAETVDGQDVIDVKLAGTAIVVDAARILALACGLMDTSTADRLQKAGRQLGIPESEHQGWVTAFFYLQALRLKQQILTPCAHAGANRVPIHELNLVDRQMLKAAFRAIRSLQQRLQLDYVR